MNKKLIVISITALIGFVVFAYFSTNKPQQTAFPEQAVVYTQEATGSGRLADRTLGTGKHIMVEYSDLQCPACKSLHDFMNQTKGTDPSFRKLMEEQYTLVYRHYPLIRIHKNAEIAARSAEAAGIQGKFYEFIDKAFTSQADWSGSDDGREFFVALAKELGLDTEKFVADIDSAAVTDKIGADIKLAEQGGIQGTPTIFIDGQKIENFGTFDQLKQIIIDLAKD